MNVIIQKFGGTSLSTQHRREMVADRIIESIKKGYRPVVVVSAIGRKGDPYATDTLLSLINNSKSNLEKREIDILLCCGEIISAVVLGETMQKRGCKIKVLTGGQAGIITNNNYRNAEIIKVETNRVKKLLEEEITPIITGFQGITLEGDFTTLGRGGSDVTGAVLGEALNAEFIEIYTDVDGIMTADPRIVPEAKVIYKISYNEVFQFAEQGAKVIHPKAVEYAMRANLPLYIKNSMTNSPGTVITSQKDNSGRVVSGITHMPNRTQINVIVGENDCYDDNNDLFTILAKNNISIDLINVFPSSKVFTVDGNETERVLDILKDIGIEYTLIKNCSKIALIGDGMRGVPGVMAIILKTLKQNNIKILQTADSYNTIWCLVSEEDTIRAINSLHGIFKV